MALKDLLKKKDKARDSSTAKPTQRANVPEFTFMRTTTSTQETIEPPSFPGDPERGAPLLSPKDARSGFGRFRRHSNASSAGSAAGSGSEVAAAGTGERKSGGGGSGSGRLHFGRTRSSTSVNVPGDLPDVGGDGVARTEEDEARWEKRATVLVMKGPLAQGGASAPPSPGVVERGNPMSPTRPEVVRKPSVAAPADEVRGCGCVWGGWGWGRAGLDWTVLLWTGLRLRTGEYPGSDSVARERQ